MGLQGVRGVNYVELTQEKLSDGATTIFSVPLYDFDSSNKDLAHGGVDTNALYSGNYGWFYNFNQFYGSGKDGVVLPSVEPSVFELKNPNENIKGVVL